MQESAEHRNASTPSLHHHPSQQPAFTEHVPLGEQQIKSRRKQIKEILKSAPRIRRPFKLVNQLMALLMHEPLFQPISNNFRVISQVAQKIEYHRFSRGETIYHIRDVSDNFYLLLSGTVHLTLPQMLEQTEPEPSNIEETQPSTENDIFSAFLKLNQRAITEPQNKQNELQYIQKIVRVIEAGDCFGEIMKEQNLRQTGAVAIEPCDVLFLNRKSYDNLLKAQLKSENRNIYTFLQKIPLFQSMGPFALSQICMLITEQRYLYGQNLFQSGHPITHIHIVRTGSFKLIRKIDTHAKTLANSRLEHKIVTKSKKNAQYLIVQEGEVLGDGQTLELRQHYEDSCICQSHEATVLSIDKKQFFKVLLEDPINFEAAKAIITAKNRWKKNVVRSFVEKRTRKSLMNVYLTDPKKSCSEIQKKLVKSGGNIKQDLLNEQFFYHQFNKTIIKVQNEHRFSLSKNKCRTEPSKSPNLFTITNKKKAGVPHGIQDIVEMVKLKASFQRRFRKTKIKNLFKFNKDEAPQYIKSRFQRSS